MDNARVNQYFERIGLEMPEEIIPDGEFLKKLSFHNIISIPYENTQFLTKKIIPCNVDELFQRIVVEKKGGICHDIACLFGWFLEEIGYEVVHVGTVSFVEKIKTHIHRTLVVTDCNNTKWLTEVGYSPMFTNKAPFLYEFDLEQERVDGIFKLEKKSDEVCLVGPNEYCSFCMKYWDLSPEVGTQIKEMTIKYEDPAGEIKRNIAIGTPEGRRTLTGNTYRESFNGNVYSYECDEKTLPWAYSQFGLNY